MEKRNKPRKVPMSFKTEPKFKQIIEVLAHSSGQKNSSVYLNQVVRKGINADAEIAELKRKLAFYETSVQSLYEKNKGRTAQFQDGSDGGFTSIQVKKPEDMQIILIKCYDILCTIHTHRLLTDRDTLSPLP